MNLPNDINPEDVTRIRVTDGNLYEIEPGSLKIGIPGFSARERGTDAVVFGPAHSVEIVYTD